MKRISTSLVSNDVFFGAQYVAHQANCALHSSCAFEVLIPIIMQIHQKVNTFAWKQNWKKWGMSGCSALGNGKTDIRAEILTEYGLSMSRPSNAKQNRVKWYKSQTENIPNRICCQWKMKCMIEIFFIENVIEWHFLVPAE